jgi:hypothetical protein
VNRFTERYRTKGRRRVRSRNARILLLKKKKECEAMKEAPMRKYRQKGSRYDDTL